jgi:hypothetical protein
MFAIASAFDGLSPVAAWIPAFGEYDAGYVAHVAPFSRDVLTHIKPPPQRALRIAPIAVKSTKRKRTLSGDPRKRDCSEF